MIQNSDQLNPKVCKGLVQASSAPVRLAQVVTVTKRLPCDVRDDRLDLACGAEHPLALNTEFAVIGHDHLALA